MSEMKMTGKLMSLCQRHIFFCLVLWRLLNALLLRTYFTPDEHWQSLEVASKLVFGEGVLTWEWQEGARIRGFTHPLIFAALYWVLKVTGWDTTWMVANSPKLLQAFFAAICDWATFKLAQHYFGLRVAWYALLVQATSWFNLYCLCRTYSNSLEATLTAAALLLWTPAWEGGGAGGGGQAAAAGGGGACAPRERAALACAALCVAVRPTSGALWLAVGLLRLSHLRGGPAALLAYLARGALPVAGGVVGFSVLLDSRLYGAPTLCAWNFLRFNVLRGGSALFGAHPWHWLGTQGLPACLGPALPLFLRGAAAACARRPAATGPLALAAWFLAAHSVSAHKEFRFLMPVLPLCHMYAGFGVACLLPPEQDKKDDDERPGEEEAADRRRKKQSGWARSGVVAVTALNLLVGGYFATTHQRGPLAAVEALRPLLRRALYPPPHVAVAAAAAGGGGGDARVAFWMPCHSTPLHSHLHFPGPPPAAAITTGFLTLDCTPRLPPATGGGGEGEDRAAAAAAAGGGLSEHQRFLQEPPPAFAAAHFCAWAGGAVPRFLVAYDSTLYGGGGGGGGGEEGEGAGAGALGFFAGLGYAPVASVFHAHFNGDRDDPEPRRRVVILESASRAGQPCAPPPSPPSPSPSSGGGGEGGEG